MIYIGCIIILAVGLLMALAPSFWWEITESWKSNATEPSDSYLRLTRIEGIVFSLVSIVCFIGMLFLG